MLQSNFKTKLNTAEHRARINKWCVWKSLCKSNPEKFKIKIYGDERLVTLVLLEYKKIDPIIPGAQSTESFWPIEHLEWSLE